MFEDAKRVIRSVSRRRTDNKRTKPHDKQNNTQKTRLRNTNPTTHSVSEPWCPGRVSNSCSASATRRITVKQHELLPKVLK